MAQLIPALLLAAFQAVNTNAGQPQKDQMLRGIKQLAVVVEKMDDADAKCGITQDAVQAAAAKTLADNAMEVAAARRDFQPFLYIRTTSLHTSDGQCVTYALTTLRAYVAPPQLAWTPAQPTSSVEIVLQEQGGIVYSPTAATHPQTLEGAVRRYVERTAAAIKAANSK